jgi:hypothetical protein
MSDYDDDFIYAEESYGFEYEEGGGYEGGFVEEEPDPYGDEDFGDSPDDIYGEDIGEEFVEEPQYETEIGAFGEEGRITLRPTAENMQMVLNEGGLSGLSQVVGREYKSPGERFVGVVDAICKNLEIDEGDIQSMLGKSNRLKNIEYINPVGYIVGYLTTDGGKGIDKVKVDQIFRQIPEPRYKNLNVGIEQPDVIRYARFWVNFRRSWA